MGMHNNAHAHAQHPNTALAMPGILEEDPEPPTPSRDTNLDQGGIGTGTATGTGTGTGTGPNTPAGDGAAAGVNGAATSGEVGAERQPGAEAGSEGGAEQDAAALRNAAASAASQVQHAVQTTPSLAIFDVSQSTVDVRGGSSHLTHIYAQQRASLQLTLQQAVAVEAIVYPIIFLARHCIADQWGLAGQKRCVGTDASGFCQLSGPRVAAERWERCVVKGHAQWVLQGSQWGIAATRHPLAVNREWHTSSSWVSSKQHSKENQSPIQ